MLYDTKNTSFCIIFITLSHQKMGQKSTLQNSIFTFKNQAELNKKCKKGYSYSKKYNIIKNEFEKSFIFKNR